MERIKSATRWPTQVNAGLCFNLSPAEALFARLFAPLISADVAASDDSCTWELGFRFLLRTK